MSKGFAILDLCHETIKKSSLSSKMGGQLALDFNGIETNYFLCKSHRPMKIFFNKIIINVFFNNYRKQQNGKIRKESVKQFKKRQLSKSKWSWHILSTCVPFLSVSLTHNQLHVLMTIPRTLSTVQLLVCFLYLDTFSLSLHCISTNTFYT